MAPSARPMPLPARPPWRAGGAPRGVGLVVLAGADAPAAGPWPGLHALLDHLHAAGIPCVAISPAPRAALAGRLAGMACAARLPMRVGREDLAAAPSWAAAMLLACRRLAVAARHAVVIADDGDAAAAGAEIGCAVIRAAGGLDQAIPIAAWGGIDG